MGAGESKTAEPRSQLNLDEEERRIASGVFCSLAHGKKSFNKDSLQHFTSPVLDHQTSARLFDLLEGPLPQKYQQHKGHHARSPQHQSHEINLHHFISHLANLLKGDVPDLAHSCMLLASNSPKAVSAQDLITFVNNILQSYEKLLMAHCSAYQSWIFAAAEDSHLRLARSLLSPLLHPDKPSIEASSQQMFTEEQVTDWLTQCSIFLQVLTQVLHGAFQFYQTEPQQMTFHPQLPHVRDTNWSRLKSMLDFPTVLYLNFSLPSELQTEWKLLFSSSLHGCSFSQLLQLIKNKGLTYIIVRDKDGYMFGGFAAVPWDLSPKFVGNSYCFLFTVKPSYCCYKPTGYNANFMYLNHQVQTLPNGLGMGGQFEFFGLWIDQSFDHGHSKASARGCTTYGSPRLSAKEEFEVDCLEVWAVGRKKKEGEEDEEEDEAVDGGKKAGKKSLLDKVDTADKFLLDMVDKGTISDAMRDEPLVEETKAHSTIISPF
ncbi:hypothetical protein BsWGS_22662 [Bradybaena similaris]